MATQLSPEQAIPLLQGWLSAHPRLRRAMRRIRRLALSLEGRPARELVRLEAATCRLAAASWELRLLWPWTLSGGHKRAEQGALERYVVCKYTDA